MAAVSRLGSAREASPLPDHPLAPPAVAALRPRESNDRATLRCNRRLWATGRENLSLAPFLSTASACCWAISFGTLA
jgi:hypothetical protein